MRASELRALEEQRALARSARVASVARRRRAVVSPRAPGEGWDAGRLRAEVEQVFREVGAKVIREEGGS